MAAQVPLGKQRHLAPQQRLVVGRQLAGAGGELPAHQRVDRVAEQRVGVVLVERRKVGRLAQVGKQQEALCQVLRVDFGCVQLRLAQQARDVDERPAVFLVGRCVHGDEAAAVGERGAEVAPETRVLGGGSEGERAARELRREPALERVEAYVHEFRCEFRRIVTF